MKKRNLRLTDLMEKPTLEGCGDTIELTLEGDKRTQPGRALERWTVRIAIPRFQLRHFLEAVSDMHDRDLERLERERRRIETERTTLNRKP